MAKLILGLVLMVAGAAFGLYAGIWWAFVGGILDILREIKAPELDATSLAVGIAKVVFAGPIGWVSFAVAVLPGCAFVMAAASS